MILTTKELNKYNENFNAFSTLESPSKDNFYSYNSIAGLRNIAFRKYQYQKQKKLEEAELSTKIAEFKSSK